MSSGCFLKNLLYLGVFEFHVLVEAAFRAVVLTAGNNWAVVVPFDLKGCASMPFSLLVQSILKLLL